MRTNVEPTPWALELATRSTTIFRDCYCRAAIDLASQCPLHRHIAVALDLAKATGYEQARQDFIKGQKTYIDVNHKVMKPIPKVPLSFEAWCSESNVELHYQSLHDEYGDSACLLSDYKTYHYQAYLERFKQGPAWVETPAWS